MLLKIRSYVQPSQQYLRNTLEMGSGLVDLIKVEHSLGWLEVIMKIEELLEDFTQDPKPGSRPGSLKRKAASYLGKSAGDKLSKTDLRRLLAKANKMKKSTIKSQRQRGVQLARQVSFVKNMSNA